MQMIQSSTQLPLQLSSLLQSDFLTIHQALNDLKLVLNAEKTKYLEIS